MTAVTFQEAATQVKQRLDIVDVIGRHVPLRKAGRNYTGLCPFHPEKTPSFSVSREKQVFNCFGCGVGGDSLAFLMKIENKTYGELIQDLAADQGIEIKQEGRHASVEKEELELLYQLQSLAGTFYQEQLRQAPSVLAYLSDRQVDTRWQQHFGLGFAPQGWENLVRFLKQQVDAVQRNPMLLEKAGLATIRTEGSGFYDRFRNRLIIPIHDERGRLVAFGGRSLDPEDNPKYLNSPETPIYVKNRILYGFSQSRESIRTAKYAVIMEGYFDVISAHMAGVTQAVGVCGTALSESHIRLLVRAGAETLYLCFDSDVAGQKAALRSIELIQHMLLEEGLSLKVIRLPGEKDPDDFLKTHGAHGFLNCLNAAENFLQFKFNAALSQAGSFDDFEGRIQAVQLISPLLLEIRQPVIRHEYLKQLAEQLQLPEETLMLELKRLEEKNNLYQYKKSYSGEAISDFPQRYIGKKTGKTRDTPRRTEDISGFRRTLSSKIPLEEKEHLLISYLLMNKDAYSLVMDTLKSLTLESPLAIGFVEALAQVEGQWSSNDALIDALQLRFHETQDTQQAQFLAHRLLVADELQESYESMGKGLKSFDSREKLGRDVRDIAERLRFLRKQANLTSLAKNVRQHEQQAEDQMALDVQLQLRAALSARQKRNGLIRECQSSAVEPEQQGV